MTDPDDPASEYQSLRYVGPATEAVLAAADIEAVAIQNKQVSYQQLVNEGVNPGVAAKLRREHSLPWRLEGFDAELDTRSRTVRGLREEERRWIAQSSADWEAGDVPSVSVEEDSESTGGYGETLKLVADPDTLAPTTTLDSVDGETATALAEAGVNTVQRLAAVATEQLATALEVDEPTVRQWQEEAQQYLTTRDQTP